MGHGAFKVFCCFYISYFQRPIRRPTWWFPNWKGWTKECVQERTGKGSLERPCLKRPQQQDGTRSLLARMLIRSVVSYSV